MTKDVVVIGGGISGLTTAYALKQKGLDVAVLERQVNPGGNAVSERFNGFLMEHGPSTVNPTVSEAVTLMETLGLAGQRRDLSSNVKQRYLVAGDQLKGIPIHPMGFMLSDYMSIGGRLRMAAEFLMPRRRGETPDESVAQFISRRFGHEFNERVMDPLVGGIYAGRSENLSISAVFPKLVEMEQQFGSISRAIMRSAKGRMPGRRLYSWQDGIATLPKALAAELGESLHCGVAVTKVVKMRGGFRVEAKGHNAVATSSVVFAVQPHVACALMSDLDVEAAMALAGMSSPPLSVVYLGYRRQDVDHPLDGLGYLSPRREGKLLTGAQFCSTMFEGRAPDGFVSMTGYLGGARNAAAAQVSPDELISQVHREFKDMLGITGEPVVSKARQWSLGLPQYAQGHSERVESLNRLNSRVPGAFVTGNFLKGPSVAICVREGLLTAEKVMQSAQGTASSPLRKQIYG